ncbi:hypothetical protein DEO72_LG10g2530 [Vigna unguiculata]|uniref:Uncharacterized protein n=1 Tax=Vigna unguiculata TaxID=3917 RepID=A0A4D6NH88_VIGUN|nr:hypothetical protein DEO72_LG10g2530 [Vigna unguiculata]
MSHHHYQRTPLPIQHTNGQVVSSNMEIRGDDVGGHGGREIMAIVVMEGVAGQFKAREDNEKGRFMVDEGTFEQISLHIDCIEAYKHSAHRILFVYGAHCFVRGRGAITLFILQFLKFARSIRLRSSLSTPFYLMVLGFGGKLVYKCTKKRASRLKCPVNGKRIQGVCFLLPFQFLLFHCVV